MATDGNGLYYMRARYYSPEIRRFINQDIVTGIIENSQSLNRYAYCQGNPVNYFDPFGLEPCEFFTGLGHGMLNLMGLIPGIGDVFDITNAIWYALDGNWGRCFESGIAALPFIGNLLPDRRTCDYVRRVLNIASYGGTAVLAGQGMVDGGKALWTDISSGQCSGWSIFLGVANIGLNGATLFFSGKSFVSETKDLNKMLKADGVTDGLLGPLKDNGGYLNPDAVKKNSSVKVTSNLGNEIDITPSKNHTTVTRNPGTMGTPNSSVDILDRTGNIETRRWYDSVGKAYRDVDMTNHGNPKTHPEFPHEHIWKYDKDGKPIGR